MYDVVVDEKRSQACQQKPPVCANFVIHAQNDLDTQRTVYATPSPPTLPSFHRPVSHVYGESGTCTEGADGVSERDGKGGTVAVDDPSPAEDVDWDDACLSIAACTPS